MRTRTADSAAEKLLRRRWARRALGLYSLPGERASLRFVARSFNTVFCVRMGRRPFAALRLGAAQRIHAEGTEQLEAAWLRALQRDAVVRVPAVFDTAGGAATGLVRCAGEVTPRLCVLFEWVPGPRLAERLSAEGAVALGRTAALLHEHSASSAAPAPGQVLVADRTLYWRLPNLLGSVAGHGRLLTEALARADAVLAALFAQPPNPPQLVHGDLSPNNALVSADGLVPIDFQDLVLGLDVEDLSFSLASFERFSGADELREHFRRGYASVRRWPELAPEILTTLVAARRLQQLNLTLALGRPGAEEATRRLSAAVATWMSTPVH